MLGMKSKLVGSAQDVATAIIEAKQPEGVDQMQLHKLLYLVQAASLVWFNEPAFDDRPIEAWVQGPVTRGIAGTYMGYSFYRIKEPKYGDSSRLPSQVRWTVDKIVSKYGNLSGPDLAASVKGPGTPWTLTRGDLEPEERSEEEIPTPLIAKYHRRHGIIPAALDATDAALAQAFFDGDDGALADLFERATGSRPTVS